MAKRNQFPAGIQDLLETETRSRILKIVFSQKASFTRRDVIETLRKQNVNVSISTLSQCLTSLLYRRYLSETSLKNPRGKGRPIAHYTLLKGC